MALAGLISLSTGLLGGCGGGEGPGPVSGQAAAGSREQAAAVTSNCPPLQATPVFQGAVPKPESVLGFALGSREVSSAESDRFLQAVDGSSARVVTGVAATSVEGRPLRYAIVGREANVSAMGLQRLQDAVRKLRDPATSAAEAAALAASTPAILWISANVHGNEESGTDAALRVLHELADRQDCDAARILDNSVVVILPIQNPDGREADTRRNAYGFDMNRDWFARTQPETDGKLELLRQYPPLLFIDAHEMGQKKYFFPPNADPVYHEVPDRALAWINGLYAPALAAEFRRQKIAFFTGATYDLYAAEYGDSVPTIGFHAAGMTFEKHNGDAIATRLREQYVAMWSSLSAAAAQRQRLLGEWRLSQLQARDQGQAGLLDPNIVQDDAKSLHQVVPALAVRHYFFPDDPLRRRELAQLVRRLQRMDVQVWRLSAPLQVPDYRPYGAAPRGVTLPAGSYWVPMAQRQKHWIQAMLHEDPYIPTSYSYDVSAWSNPLLLNVSGGSSGAVLSPQASLASAQAAPAWAAPAAPPRIGLLELPGTAGFESAGAMRYLFEKAWSLPYTFLTPDTLLAGLDGIDVLVVPDGSAKETLQKLGSRGQRALADWVRAGGRYVGYQRGAELAVGVGVSTAVLKASGTATSGALVRIRLDGSSPLAAGVATAGSSAATAWIMYDDDPEMTPGLGTAAATFPAPDTADFHVSGLKTGVEELAGSAAIADEAVGNGRCVVFSFDPNFRGWAEGTQRILWNAVLGSNPALASVAAATTPDAARQAAVQSAQRAAQALPDLGRPIRIVVRSSDADATRTLLQGHGAEFQESRRGGRTVFLIANRDGLSGEEHPFAHELAHELRQRVTPLAVRMP
ncbi:M14 family zinc carboxypeptidase [Azohydromonas aeria]|uniref:M14 family zinc carboxypeptidase n=1 Tax=Azohydromonas aeria TaxID=2590212 RepID=UPI0012FAF80C|nr:M14 family zinc carboxypeptidase [Azohydromonas aeria]